MDNKFGLRSSFTEQENNTKCNIAKDSKAPLYKILLYNQQSIPIKHNHSIIQMRELKKKKLKTHFFFPRSGRSVFEYLSAITCTKQS